ncbi:MAG TPA: molybdate ABC transporter substrate-binding protein [Candidatus Binatia bacterium]|nr:molybdate ABC transporter substrate-binding protein [Candidatus Binatia bacterium]
MKNGRRIKIATLLLASALLSFLPATARADEMLVSAAASLTDVLKEIGKNYQTKSKHKIRLALGPSNFLARQIDEGAPADIFFSADVAQMDFLEKNRRLEPDTRKNLLSNQLVIVVPADSKLAIVSPKDLLKPEVKKIALADPTAVPVGVYSSKYLSDEGLWNKLTGKIVPVLDVRATLAAVESANVEAGFVYRTDAAISNKVKVVYQVPPDKGPKIIYPIAVVRASTKKEAARDLMSYLLSPAGKSIFRKFGFVLLD